MERKWGLDSLSLWDCQSIVMGLTLVCIIVGYWNLVGIEDEKILKILSRIDSEGNM